MGEIYLEIIAVDKALRVTAVDASTGIEVVFTAPKNTARARIDALASAKLHRRIARERGQAESVLSERMSRSSEANERRGKLV